MDQRDVGDREDYLRFATEPLEEAVEVIGRIRADLHVESDAPDTDFAVKLVDKPLRADAGTRPARNAIHHDAAHPSRVLLPVTRRYGPPRSF